MLQLKLDLCVTDSSGVTTNVGRVFDSKSLNAADVAIRSGVFGRRSKHAYYLKGSYLDLAGEWKPIWFTLYVTKNGLVSRSIPSELRHLL
jgi:hypothetical protein